MCQPIYSAARPRHRNLLALLWFSALPSCRLQAGRPVTALQCFPRGLSLFAASGAAETATHYTDTPTLLPARLSPSPTPYILPSRVHRPPNANYIYTVPFIVRVHSRHLS